MSDNNKKNKDIEGLEAMEAMGSSKLARVLEWMASPRVYWENFKVTVPVKNPNEIKWFALKVAEA